MRSCCGAIRPSAAAPDLEERKATLPVFIYGVIVCVCVCVPHCCREKEVRVEVSRQREVKWLDMFHHWDKWIKHRFQKVLVCDHHCAALTAAGAAVTVCPLSAGEAALQEGHPVLPPSQSLDHAVQQPGAAGGQPRQV